MQAGIHWECTGDHQLYSQRYFYFNVFAILDTLSCLVKGILLGVVWEYMHTYRKNPGIMHAKCISRANYNFSADANQKKKVRAIERRRKKKKGICGLQGRCTWHVLLLILIIEIPQMDVKHFQGVLLKNFCDGKRKNSTPAHHFFLFVLLFSLFSYF